MSAPKELSLSHQLFFLLTLLVCSQWTQVEAGVDQENTIEVVNVKLLNLSAEIDLQLTYSADEESTADFVGVELSNEDSNFIQIKEIPISAFSSSSELNVHFSNLALDVRFNLRLTEISQTVQNNKTINQVVILTSKYQSTTEVWSIEINQTDNCSVTFSCSFAVGSSADACLLQWREEGTAEPNQELEIARNQFNLSASAVAEGVFLNNTYYVVEAVGLREKSPLNTIRAIRIFQVFRTEGVVCQSSTISLHSSPTVTPTAVTDNAAFKFDAMFYYIVSGVGAVVILLVMLIPCVCALVRRRKKKKCMMIENMEGIEEDPNEYELLTTAMAQKHSLQTSNDTPSVPAVPETKPSKDIVPVKSTAVENEAEYVLSDDDGYDMVMYDTQSSQDNSYPQDFVGNINTVPNEEDLTYDYVITEEEEEEDHVEVNPLQLHQSVHPTHGEKEHCYENFPGTNQHGNFLQYNDRPHPAIQFSHSNQSSFSSAGSCHITRELIKPQPHAQLLKQSDIPVEYHRGHHKWKPGKFGSSFHSEPTSESDLEDNSPIVNFHFKKILANERQECDSSLDSSPSTPIPDPGNATFRGNLLKQRNNLFHELMRYQQQDSTESLDSISTTQHSVGSRSSPVDVEEEDDSIDTVPNAAYEGFRQSHHTTYPLITSPSTRPTQINKPHNFSNSFDGIYYVPENEL